MTRVVEMPDRFSPFGTLTDDQGSDDDAVLELVQGRTGHRHASVASVDMSETVEDVVADLWSRVNASIVAVSMATSGLHKMHEQFSAPGLVDPSINPDPNVFVGAGDPNDPATRAHGSMPLSELLALTDRGGEASVLLGRQWLVALFQDWEDNIRPRLAKALNRPKAEVVHPAFGDLRLLRHDIIHKKGIATAEHAGRCDELRWFRPGEAIVIRDQHFVELLDALYSTPVT